MTIVSAIGKFLFCLVISLSSCKKKTDPEPGPGQPPVENPDALSAIAKNVHEKLATPEPSAEAEALYGFLRKQYGKKTLSGVMTLHSFDEVNWLRQQAGAEPAIVGLDFMHCNRDYAWYDDLEPVKDAKAYWDKNGIPVFCWHWRDPSRQTEAFYTSDTGFDVSRIDDPSSPEYTAMLSDIDVVAGYLKILQSQKVPVLWRPLHEAEGGWFWWGAKGAAPLKKLWHTLYDRLVHHHGLNNLIWVWTQEGLSKEWYPGDDYVDIVGRDLYRQGNHSIHNEEFQRLLNLFGGKKIIALSECGSMPDPINYGPQGPTWSWFMPWYGDFVRKAEHNSLDLWKSTLSHDKVITREDMPSLK